MLSINLIVDSDISQLLDFVCEMKVSIAGTESRAIIECVLRDAFQDNRVAVITASDANRLVGYAIAISDQAAYWRATAKHHPFLAAQIMVGRFFRRNHEGRKDNADLPLGLLSRLDFEMRPESWHDSAPDIAKVVMIGVRPEFKGRGIARSLYACLFEELASRCVKRVDACVAHDNHPSLLLHANTGWQMRYTGHNVFCTRTIEP